MSDIVIRPLRLGPASGATISFPFDRARIARLRARFPKARWSRANNVWILSGATAAHRLAAWAADEDAIERLAARLAARHRSDREWDEADPARATALRVIPEAINPAPTLDETTNAARWVPSKDIAARLAREFHGPAGPMVMQTILTGLVPGDSGMVGNTRLTYLAPGRVLRQHLTQGSGPDGRRIVLGHDEIDAAPEVLARVLACVVWEHCRPRGTAIIDVRGRVK